MASGDILFHSNARAIDGTWGTGPVEINLDLFDPISTNIDTGDIKLTARVGTPPYGQGWNDSRSPFRPGVTYEVTIKEV